jgi:hypothetical protein
MFVEVVADKFAAPVCVSVSEPINLLHRPDCPYFQHKSAKMRLATPWELRTLRACCAFETKANVWEHSRARRRRRSAA